MTMRLITRPACAASLRQRCTSFSSWSSSGESFFSGWRSMPGTSPATSQFDWLISMTAISVLSWSKAVRDRLRSFDCGMGYSIGLLARAEGDLPPPLPPYHLLTGPARPGDHDPVQHGGEDSTLDRKLEAPPGEEILDHRAAAGLLPQAPEQQGRANALAGEPRGVAGLDLGENHGPLGVTGDGTGQALEGAGGGNGFLSAEVLDDALLVAAVLAHGLDEVEVGVTVDALLANEHAD